MNDALRRSFAKRAHCLWEFCLRGRHISLLNSYHYFLYRRAERRPQRRVTLMPLHILTGSLYG